MTMIMTMTIDNDNDNDNDNDHDHDHDHCACLQDPLHVRADRPPGVGVPHRRHLPRHRHAVRRHRRLLAGAAAQRSQSGDNSRHHPEREPVRGVRGAAAAAARGWGAGGGGMRGGTGDGLEGGIGEFG